MALDKSPDMEGLTPAERAAIYKQRAAAAGIGRAPNTSGAAPAAKPAAASPVTAPAAQPTTTAAATAATGVTGGGVPAKVAAAAAAKREQVAAVARGETAAPAHKEQADRLVYVWPHLVTIEFLAAVLMLLSLLLVSLFIQSPLEGHANLDKTPNPSKAPWYFMNLQELLLHMHPALAGVLIPGAVVFAAIPVIPYIDRSTADVGKWFGTPKAKAICWFTTWYTIVVETALILFDEFIGLKPLISNFSKSTGLTFLVDPEPLGIGALSIVDVILPTLIMVIPIVVLILLLNAIYKPDGVRDYMFALFTGFVVTYFFLTIIGTFFRGQGMHLYWPWDPRQARIE